MKPYFIPLLVFCVACGTPSETKESRDKTPSVDTTALLDETSEAAEESPSLQAEELFTLTEVTEAEYKRVAALGDTLKFPGLYVYCTRETRAAIEECADREEYRLMKLNAGEVQRQADRLVFSFDKKKIEYQSVTHDDAGEQYVEYRYQGKLNFGLHVVEVHGYEWRGWKILDPHTEKDHFAYGIPVASPSGRRIICSNVDLIAEFSANGIQLFEYDTEKGLQLRWELDLEGYGLESIAWESETSFLAQKVTHLGEGEMEFTFVRVTLL